MSSLGLRLAFFEDRNEFTGEVPLELTNAPALVSVVLYDNDLTGSIDPVFCMESRLFELLVADCLEPNPQIICTCCTHCCDTDGIQCNEVTQSSSPTTPAPTSGTGADVRFAQLQELLKDVSDPVKLSDESSDQYAAAVWMSQQDSSPYEVTNSTRQLIIQEYVMVLLYLSTKGEYWKSQNSFLTATSVCIWDGVECDDGDLIKKLDLRSNNLTGPLVSALFVWNVSGTVESA